MNTGVHYPLPLKSLPAGWKVAYVGDFTKQIEPGFASGEHNKVGEGVPHLRPMNVDRDGRIDLSVVKYVGADKDARRLQRGDVLFNNTNSPELVGKTAVLSQEGDFAFSNHMTRIRFSDDVLPEFAALQLHFLWMRGYFRYNCVKHVNQASVSSKSLARTVPFIWAPSADQERIVADIEKQFSRLDEAVANLKRVKANLKRYKTKVLGLAAQGDLPGQEHCDSSKVSAREGMKDLRSTILAWRRETWEKGLGKRSNYKIPDEPNAEYLPQLPPGWVWMTVEELGPPDRPCAYGVLQPGEETESGVPLVRVGDIADGRVARDNLKRISPQIAAAYPRTQLEGGELLLTLVGTVGRAAIAPPELRGANVARAVAVVPLCPHVNPRWIELWFRSPQQVQLLNLQAHEVARKTLNLEDVRKAPVALPPLAVQNSIVREVDARLSQTEATERDVAIAVMRVEALRHAVLADAFSLRHRQVHL